METTTVEKILLDTDIGNDIDDMIAIAYLLSQPQCRLMGITTVTAQSVNRAKLARAILLEAGRPDIPVYPGAERPILVSPLYSHCPQASSLPFWPHEGIRPQGEYLSFMRQTIRDNQGEITLLGIGPLTNIGLLFAMDPELPAMLKRLVVMCGVYERTPYKSAVEWNARNDPHSAAIVYRSQASSLLTVGQNVTALLCMPKQNVLDCFSHQPLLRAILDMAGSWLRQVPAITLHDPLCAALIFAEELCDYKQGSVALELKSDYVTGMTHFDDAADGPHRITTEVDVTAFYRHFFQTFKLPQNYFPQRLQS